MMTYLEECEVFLSSLQLKYNELDKEYREASDKYDALRKAVDASKQALKPLKQMVSNSAINHQYSDVYEKHYEEAVAITATLENEMQEYLKKRDSAYQEKFDLEYGGKRNLEDKIRMMKKVGIVSDMINTYFLFYVDKRNHETRGLVFDGKTAMFSSNRYASISNFNGNDLGVELQENFMKHQIAEGATRKASKVFSLGFKDQSLYLILLDFAGKLKTTYILKDDAEFATVETHKYDPKIKHFYLRKELEDKIPRSELVKTFFDLLDHKKDNEKR